MKQEMHRRPGGRWLWIVGLAFGLVTGTLVALELAHDPAPFDLPGTLR